LPEVDLSPEPDEDPESPLESELFESALLESEPFESEPPESGFDESEPLTGLVALPLRA
jgi:hypothetical protein